MARSGARTGRVTRVTSGRVYVELAEVAPGFEFGPVLDTVGDLTVGDRVVVTALARDDDELVVIGRIGGADLAATLAPYATDVDLATGLAGKAPTAHNHHADNVNDGVLALARLPVAPSGNNNPTQIPRADDARLSDARTPIAHSASLITSDTLAIARLPVATTAVEIARSPGTASAGTATNVVRADHVHPVPAIELLSVGAGAIVLGPSIAAAGEGVSAHRSAGVVTLGVYVTASASVSLVLTMPAGWLPNRGLRDDMNLTISTNRAVFLQTNGQLTVEGGLTSGQLLFGQITYVCNRT